MRSGGDGILTGVKPPAFFLLAAAWAAIAVPVWLTAYVHGYAPRGPLPALFWHGHEMVFGFGLAAVAGFLPVRGVPLALLALLWLAGRVAMLVPGAALLDLAFPAALIAVVARELIAGRDWRNLPMLAALALLFAGNLLFHLGVYAGLWLGIATLCMLIALPAPGEPLRFVLRLGYAWLAFGLILLGLDLPGALHAVTVGAIGTMTLGAMTRATPGRAGATLAICLLVTLAAVLRVASAFAGAQAVVLTSLAGVAWSAAFAALVLRYLIARVR